MVQTVVVAGAVLVVSAATLAAQTPVKKEISAEAQQQVIVFEGALRSALEKATGNVAERAREITPDIVMRYQVGLEIRGLVMPTDGSYVFVVDPPIIEPTFFILTEVNQRFPRSGVRNAGATSGPPPAATQPSSQPPTPIVNLAGEYTDFVHSGIVSAMLDHARSLPITDAQTLTVIVSTGAAPQMNPSGPRDRKLHLVLKGADLIALRQNRITREEARKKIEESRY